MEEILKVKIVEDKNMRQQIWQTYIESFADTDDFCAQDQMCYNEKNMETALLDSDYWKFILLLDGRPIGLCLLTNNLTKARIAYCNDRYLRKKFPNYTAQGKLYYVTAICVLPNQQKQGKGIELLKAVCQFIFDTQSMVAYDHSEAKNPNLTSIIQWVGKKFAPNSQIPLDKQVYVALFYDHNGKPD